MSAKLSGICISAAIVAAAGLGGWASAAKPEAMAVAAPASTDKPFPQNFSHAM